MIQIKKDYITNGTKRRSGLLLDGVKYLVAHDTGNPGSTAQNNVNYYKRTAGEVEVSAHIFVDDVNTIECVPTGIYGNGIGEKAWHVRYGNKPKALDFEANDYSIAIEWCHGGKIDIKKSYDNYVTILAELCEWYNLDPKTQIVSHAELDPLRRTDPIKALESYGYSYTGLIDDVVSYMSKKYLERAEELNKQVQEIAKGESTVVDNSFGSTNAKPKGIIDWLIFSSADPKKASKTIQGVLVMMIPTIMTGFGSVGISLTVEMITKYIEVAVYALGGGLTMFGLARKLYYNIKDMLNK